MKRKLGKREEEHKKAIQKAEMEVLALAGHAWRFDHRVDVGNVAILDYNSNLWERFTVICLPYCESVIRFEQGQRCASKEV